MMASFARAARRAARDADLVHAHWLPSGAVALATGKPFVVQLWGTDVELARRTRVSSRSGCSRGRGSSICASNALAEAARELGARRGARDPERGRAARARGRAGRAAGGAVRRAALAGEGHPRARAGGRGDEADGRGRRPAARAGARGARVRAASRAAAAVRAGGRGGRAVAPRGLRRRLRRGDGRTAGRWSRARSAGCSTWSSTARPACSCRRATSDALRAALERLLGDAELRRRLGEAGRERIREHFTWPAVTDRDDPGLRGRACRLSGPQSCSACSGPGSRSRAASAAAACR